MSDKKIDNKVLHNVKRAAIRATPKDTGNLAYNALVVHTIPNGFSVRYRSSVAGYGVFLNDYRKLRGFAQGKLNPHYLWFDNGVHQNVINELVRSVAGKKPAKPDKIIEPTKRTFQESALDLQFQREVATQNKQLDAFKQWNSRFDQFKNHNEKGWGV